MQDFLIKLELMIRQLEEHPQISITRYEINNPLSESDMQIIEDRYQVQIGASLKEFYRQVNGLRFEWMLMPSGGGIEIRNNDEIFGCARFLEILQVFDGFDGEGWFGDIWFEWMDSKEQAKRKKIKPFDYFYGEDSRCTCFLANGKLLQDDLLFHSVDYGIRELDVSFQEYLELLLETRGFFSWQLAFIKDKKPLDKFNTFLSHLHYYIPQLFPDADLSRFPKPK